MVNTIYRVSLGWPLYCRFVFNSVTKLMIDGIEYDLLSRGDNNRVVALDEKRVGKLFDLGSNACVEEFGMQEIGYYINGLICKPIEIRTTDSYEYDLLISERLYALEVRALSSNQRKKFGDRFLEQVNQLHTEGFAHWDIKRPDSHTYGSSWDNIILTREGVRLIDCGISVTSEYPDFEEACEYDMSHAREWINTVLVN